MYNYMDVLAGNQPEGSRVAIIGAGGIGFDVAEYLTHIQPENESPLDNFFNTWGVDRSYRQRGALVKGIDVDHERSAREVYLLQRKTTKLGQNLGKTTGWIHRLNLRKRGVHMLGGVQYLSIQPGGLLIVVGNQEQLLEVDNVIVCAGQEPCRDLFEPLKTAGLLVHVIGGADVAQEIDARRAIDQGCRLALTF